LKNAIGSSFRIWTCTSVLLSVSSRASSLRSRWRDDLQKAIPALTQPFFETYPQYQPLMEGLASVEYTEVCLQLRLAMTLGAMS
jgi:hypothetical protein